MNGCVQTYSCAADFHFVLLKTDFASRFPARSAFAVKGLPKVGVTFYYIVVMI